MKQKFVVGMAFRDDKCRSKALKIVVCIQGVVSAAVVGEEKDQLEVIGDGVDSVELTRRLRKKMGYAELLSVGDANSEPPAVGVAAPAVPPPYYAFPHYPPMKEPACYNPCSIL